jgi:acyl-CoA thioester hydrolase
MGAAYSFRTASEYDPPVHEKTLEIRWRDLNPWRHVNSAVYATYLEECRNELIESTAAGVDGAAGDYVLARVAIDYRRELTTDDGHVVVRCRVDRIGISSVTFREQVATPGGEIAAESEAVIVAHDPATGRSRPLSDAERRAFEHARDEG